MPRSQSAGAEPLVDLGAWRAMYRLALERARNPRVTDIPSELVRIGERAQPPKRALPTKEVYRQPFLVAYLPAFLFLSWETRARRKS
jgi:hypothetical protein